MCPPTDVIEEEFIKMTHPTQTATAQRTRQRNAGSVRKLIARIPRARIHTPATLDSRRVRARARAGSLTTNTNIALAGLQLVLGYQWLASGVDKVLLGNFPAQVGHLLAVQISSGRLPTLFAALVQSLVVPNAAAFGYAIMAGEALAGLGLVAAGLFMLARPTFEAHSKGRLWTLFAMTDRLVSGLAPVAAAGAGLLGLSYYLLDGAPSLWFTPSLAYGGAIDPGMVVALASAVLVVAQVFQARTSR